jgi:hypothetical protein
MTILDGLKAISKFFKDEKMLKFKNYFRYFFLIVTLLLASQTTLSFAADGLTLFHTETAAQKHCPKDEVVWLNLPTGIWHVKGQRWYANTKKGAYVCKKEAAADGNRASLNG